MPGIHKGRRKSGANGLKMFWKVHWKQNGTLLTEIKEKTLPFSFCWIISNILVCLLYTTSVDWHFEGFLGSWLIYDCLQAAMSEMRPDWGLAITEGRREVVNLQDIK